MALIPLVSNPDLAGPECLDPPVLMDGLRLVVTCLLGNPMDNNLLPLGIKEYEPSMSG